MRPARPWQCAGLLLALLWAVGAAAAETQMEAGLFGTVSVYTPQGKPDSVALFVSGDGGWELGVVSMARNLVSSQNAVVIGIDVRHYLAQLAKPHAGCRSLAVDFENLSHAVQKQLKLPEYLVPVLVGYSSGATLVYAALAQAPAGTFAGALSLGFCRDQDFRGARLCPGTGLAYRRNRKGDYVLGPSRKLHEPWIALQGQQDMVCNPKQADAFVAAVPGSSIVRLPKVGHGFGVERNWLPQFLSAYDSIMMHERAQFAAAASSLQGLPLIELPSSVPSDRMALLLSGDGGWAGLDRDLAQGLVSHAVSVVGLNSLKYFWKARTPDESAADVVRILRHYLADWHRDRILLIGYSFGAEVLPFVVNRLPADVRGHIQALDLLSPSTSADFEIHVSGWIPGAAESGLPITPEIERLRGIPILCIQGNDEPDSLCAQLPAHSAVSESVGEGHHFSGDYSKLLARILAFPSAAQHAPAPSTAHHRVT